MLLTQDSFVAGLGGDIYENHWHQYNTMDQLRHAEDVPAVRRLLEQWNVHYLIARKPTASHYARPLALRELLDQCTIAEYVFGEFFVARLEPVCSTVAPLPAEPVLTAKPGTYDDLDPTILLRGDWERGDEFDSAFEHTVTYTDIPGAEIRFAFEGGELTYVFTKAANRGTRRRHHRWNRQGNHRLVFRGSPMAELRPLRRPRRRPSPRRDSRHRRKPRPAPPASS